MAATPNGPAITRRQRQILDFFQEYVEANGMSPTLEEIAQHFGLTRVTIFGHVAELKRKGYLEQEAPSISRGLRLAPQHSSPRRAAPAAPRRTSLPILGSIAAGAPIEALEDPEVLELDELVPPSADVYVLRVRGDSMVDDAICDGDLVLVERTETAFDGQVVVAVLPPGLTSDLFERGGVHDAVTASSSVTSSTPSREGSPGAESSRAEPSRAEPSRAEPSGTTADLGEGEATLKRFRRLEAGVRLEPANSNLRPVDIPSACGEVQIRGIVIGVVRRMA